METKTEQRRRIMEKYRYLDGEKESENAMNSMQDSRCRVYIRGYCRAICTEMECSKVLKWLGKEEVKMENCPVCGSKLIIIAGYAQPNFCRKCDKLIITPEMYEDEENVL